MTRRWKVMLWILVPIYLFFGLFAYGFLLQIPWLLVFGWIFFLFTNIGRVNVSSISLVSAVVLLSLLLIGLQLFLSRVAEKTSRREWRWNWTLSILGIVILTFASGISAVGIVHQLGWMVNGPDRMLKNAFWDHITSRRNLKLMGNAFHQSTEQSGHLPQGALFDQAGRALHSWETLLLPHMVTGSRSTTSPIRVDVDLTRPWTDPANAAAFRTRLPEFQNPPLGPDFVDGLAASHYSWNSHLLGIPKRLQSSDVKDGFSNTLLIGEVNTGHRAWGDPVNWRDPARGLHSGPDTFGGVPGGSHVDFLLLDGTIRAFNTKTDPAVLQALATPAGGEIIPEF